MRHSALVSWRPVSAALLLLFSFVGCTGEVRDLPTSRPVKDPQLSQAEMIRCKEVAWDAVNSAAMLERFKPKRISEEPFEFSQEGISCYLDQKTLTTVEVAVPSGGQFSIHACFVGVTLDRTSYEVLSMRENFWP